MFKQGCDVICFNAVFFSSCIDHRELRADQVGSTLVAQLNDSDGLDRQQYKWTDWAYVMEVVLRGLVVD